MTLTNLGMSADALPASGDPNTLMMDDGSSRPAPSRSSEALDGGQDFDPGDPGPLGDGHAEESDSESRSVAVRSRAVTTQFLPEVDGLLGEVIQAAEPGGVIAAGDFPTRTVVRILFKNAQGQNGICTGWLINNEKVITAGHCMHEGPEGAWYPLSSFRVSPDATSTSAPYGTCGVWTRSTTAGWTTAGWTQDPYRFDLGALWLDCAFGVGYMGYFRVAEPVEQDARAIDGVLVGYTGSGKRVRTTGKITTSLSGRAFYTNKSTGGFSGAPRWNHANSACTPCVHALHRDNGEGLAVDGVKFDTLWFWKYDW